MPVFSQNSKAMQADFSLLEKSGEKLEVDTGNTEFDIHAMHFEL